MRHLISLMMGLLLASTGLGQETTNQAFHGMLRWGNSGTNSAVVTDFIFTHRPTLRITSPVVSSGFFPLNGAATDVFATNLYDTNLTVTINPNSCLLHGEGTMQITSAAANLGPRGAYFTIVSPSAGLVTNTQVIMQDQQVAGSNVLVAAVLAFNLFTAPTITGSNSFNVVNASQVTISNVNATMHFAWSWDTRSTNN